MSSAISTYSSSRIFLTKFGGIDPDGNWERFAGTLDDGVPAAVVTPVNGSGEAGMDDVTDCRVTLDPLNENVGIIGKVDGSGSIPITGSGAGGIGNHISSYGGLFACHMP